MTKKTKRSQSYWKKRFEQLEQASHNYGQQTYAEVEKAFNAAQRSIQSEINTWYARFALNNNVTLQEARKMLNAKELAELKWDVNQYIEAGKLHGTDPTWMKQLENASARYHISRLEALQLRTQQALEVAFGNELDGVDKMVRKVFTEDYYHSIFEVQKGFNIGWEIGQIDDKELDKVVKKPWSTDGKTFSDRIWTKKNQMVGQLHQELTRTLVQGKAPDAAIEHMMKYVDKSVKNAKHAASTLVMTEQAYFHSVSQEEAFKDLDVEEFEVVATLDSHTSEICQDMDGQHFKMKDYEPGVTAPPFHPNCRSVTAPYFDDEWSVGERAARDAEGKTYYVPDSMKYPEWKKSMVEGHTEDLKADVPGAKVKTETDSSKTVKVEPDDVRKLKASMNDSDFDEFIEKVNSNEHGVTELYKKVGDSVSSVKHTSGRGVYSPARNSIEYNISTKEQMQRGKSKYSTLAHEYGHAFDTLADFDGLHYTEVDSINDSVKIGSGLVKPAKKVASSSDEFLSALRQDMETLRPQLSSITDDLFSTDASAGVQDALEGLFGAKVAKTHWGHGDRYYNRWFNTWVKGFNKQAEVKEVFISLGIDVSNETKLKKACRIYEAASETWANIMSAETCGGAELDYVKKYLPHSHEALLDIIERLN